MRLLETSDCDEKEKERTFLVLMKKRRIYLSSSHLQNNFRTTGEEPEPNNKGFTVEHEDDPDGQLHWAPTETFRLLAVAKLLQYQSRILSETIPVSSPIDALLVQAI